MHINLSICAKANVPAFLRKRGPFDHILSLSDKPTCLQAAAQDSPREWQTMLEGHCSHVLSLQFDDIGHCYDPTAATSPQPDDIDKIVEFARVIKDSVPRTHVSPVCSDDMTFVPRASSATSMSRRHTLPTSSGFIQSCRSMSSSSSSSSSSGGTTPLRRPPRSAQHKNGSPHVLVHCQGGTSRSPACAIILLHALGNSIEASLKHVLKVHPTANPNLQILAMAGIHLSQEQLAVARSHAMHVNTRSESSPSSSMPSPMPVTSPSPIMTFPSPTMASTENMFSPGVVLCSPPVGEWSLAAYVTATRTPVPCLSPDEWLGSDVSSPPLPMSFTSANIDALRAATDSDAFSPRDSSSPDA